MSIRRIDDQINHPAIRV